MRILMIGLGSIAHTAYLPALGLRNDIELHFATRNPAVLAATGAAYRTANLYPDLTEALEAARFDAAFVHVATSAHAFVVERLLQEEIPVFVDKPLANSHDEAARIVAAAERARCPLMVGFNRRYAPDYIRLREIPHDSLFMYKHRRQEPASPRDTVFDDFIHVVDTLRFLSPAEVSRITIETSVSDGNLLSIVLVLTSAEHKAVGIMNRSAGLDEERLEVIGRGGRQAVLNLSETIRYDGAEIRTRRGDWTSVSAQRGFEAMCADFLKAARERRPVASRDILETHRICEMIVAQAEAGGV